MSNLNPEPSKVAGYSDYVAGSIKEGAGKVFGKTEWEASGTTQKATGNAEIEAARLAGTATAKKEQMTGATQETKGAILGDSKQELEGKAERLKGNVREQAHA